MSGGASGLPGRELSRAQFLMWLGQQLDPDIPLYNMIQTFRVSGEFDVAAFVAAWEHLVGDSDALRTVIVVDDGHPRQVVRAEMEAAVEVIDLSGRSDPEAAYARWQDDRKLVMHDLASRLFDCALVRLGPTDHIWYLNKHHLITDGQDFANTYRYQAERYALARAGRLDDASTPPRYAEHIAAERAHRDSPAHRRASEHWRAKLDVEVEAIDLYGRSAGSGLGRTDRVNVDVGDERSKLLRDIAVTDGFGSLSPDLSLAAVWYTLLAAALHRIADQTTVRLGTPFQARPSAADKAALGLFIEIGVIQVGIDPGETFTSLGRKVLRELLTGLANAQAGTSNADINRSYDVLLNYVNARFDDFDGLPVQTDWVHTGYGDGNHLLRLQVTDFDGAGAFTLSFDLNAEVFGRTEQAWFLDQFDRVVDAFIEDHQRPIGSFSLLSDDQRAELIDAFNRTAAGPGVDDDRAATVVDRFAAQVARTPDAVAVERGGASLTYRQLDARTDQLARHLRARGVGPEDRVAICMERSIDVVVAIWAVLKAGGCYVPIDPAHPPVRKAHVLADAAPSAVLVLGEGALGPAPSPKGGAPAVGPPVIDLGRLDLDQESDLDPAEAPLPDPSHVAYIIYTSGSTGEPKGTMVTHRNLHNYVTWARSAYQDDAGDPEGPGLDYPLYSSLAFDLTVTSIFVPLVSGGRIVVYNESDHVRGLEVLDVFEDDEVDVVKLTPAHLELVLDRIPATSRIRRLIVGGEDFKTDLARRTHDAFGSRATDIEILNEYGPTEATVGCMLHRFDPVTDTATSVPIGTPAANSTITVLDRHGMPVPPGVQGEMYIGGEGVASGYLGRPELTAERFDDDPLRPGGRRYRTGDLARWGRDGRLVFLGRRDDQVKIGGARVELGEIQAALAAHVGVREAVVGLVEAGSPPVGRDGHAGPVRFCARCGLPSNYPEVRFDVVDGDDVCEFCLDFDRFRDDVFAYFGTEADLDRIVAEAGARGGAHYDCMLLLSGGKDSSYVLSQLVDRGLRVLAWSLDNGYISEEAKANMQRVTDRLGVDLIVATTPHMNAIFADSLHRFSNVCNGCYKTIYTLAMNEARSQGIAHIFTGLSRGQLFETRLHELFRNRTFDVDEMDHAIAEARKVYHRVDDAVGRLLDVEIFADDRIFDEITFVDYFRYRDVKLDEIYEFLSTRLPWIRPGDTGRSTNCLINEAGIHVHQSERGYHNYALPYSWDVRLGHKTRDEAMAELDDDIRPAMVRGMLDDVGYEIKPPATGDREARLVAHYVAAGGDGSEPVPSAAELREHLAQRLPDYMVPAHLIAVDRIPLTVNGKVDRAALPAPTGATGAGPYVAPRSDVEDRLASIWSETLHLPRVGVHNDYFAIGGTSVPSIQIVATINEAFGIDFPLRSFFRSPTVAQQGAVVEELILEQLGAMSDDEVEAMLAEMGE